MPDLETLVVPVSEEDAAQTMTDLSEDAGLPVTSWQDGSVWKVLHSVVPTLLSDVFFAVAQIANGVILGLSRGEWLDVVHGAWFDEERQRARVTQGTVELTDAGGGPHTIAIGADTVADSTGRKLYTNTTGGTLPLNGTLSLTYQATQPGASYNVANGAITRRVTTRTGVTCANPADPSSGTWVTQLGLDRESDAAYTERLPLKWAELSTGSPPPAVKSWALAYPGVTRAEVIDTNPDGPNTVRLVVDSSAAVAGLQLVLSGPSGNDGKAPTGTLYTVVLATSETVVVKGTVSVTSGFDRATVQAAVESALATLATNTKIGGLILESQVSKAITNVAGVADRNFDSDSDIDLDVNHQLGTQAIPTIDPQLTYVTA